MTLIKIKTLLYDFARNPVIWSYYLKINTLFDNIYGIYERNFKGVDFMSQVSNNKLGRNKNETANNHYEGIKRFQARKIFGFLKITQNDAILDYGSGKGKALYEFSKFPFKKIAGVELSEELYVISIKNLNKLGLKNVEVYNEDAVDFKKIDGFNYFYLYNPFNEEILKKVLDNIIYSIKLKPRKVTIIYFNPVHSNIIFDSKLFKPIVINNQVGRAVYIFQNNC